MKEIESQHSFVPIYRHGVLKCEICNKTLARCGCCNTVHLTICDECLDAKVNSIINTPNEEILKQVEKEYGNPHYEADRVKAIIEKARKQAEESKDEGK